MNLEEQERCTVLWECSMCKTLHIDPEVPPYTILMYDEIKSYTPEPMLYWLGLTDVVCADCAARVGIPAIDKE